MSLSPRVRKQVRAAVYALDYIARAEANGQDVSRLAEKRDKSSALLKRLRCCTCCGSQISDPASLLKWEVDHLGPKCRTYRLAPDEHPNDRRMDLHDDGIDNDLHAA